MQRLVRAIALFFLFAGLSWPAASQASHFDPARVLSATETTYPITSIASGTVVLQVQLDEAGGVEGVKVIHDIPSLTKQAKRSLQQWKFKSAILDGKPARSAITAAFTFSRSVPSPFPPFVGSRRQEGKDARYQPIRVASTVPVTYPAGDAMFGTVILEVIVEKTGAIGSVEVLHGIASLTEEAQRSLRHWKFKPAELDGKPVTSPMVASFVFSHSPIFHQ